MRAASEAGQPCGQGAQVRMGATAASPLVCQGTAAVATSATANPAACSARDHTAGSTAAGTMPSTPQGCQERGSDCRLSFTTTWLMTRSRSSRCAAAAPPGCPIPCISPLKPRAPHLSLHTFVLECRCTATTPAATPFRCCSAAASCPRSRASPPLVSLCVCVGGGGILTSDPRLV